MNVSSSVYSIYSFLIRGQFCILLAEGGGKIADENQILYDYPANNSLHGIIVA
jgi:hypothetical protein